jgi:hypothetical protein
MQTQHRGNRVLLSSTDNQTSDDVVTRIRRLWACVELLQSLDHQLDFFRPARVFQVEPVVLISSLVLLLFFAISPNR